MFGRTARDLPRQLGDVVAGVVAQVKGRYRKANLGPMHMTDSQCFFSHTPHTTPAK